MIAITKLIMIGIAIVCAVTLAFILFDFVADEVDMVYSKKRNRVHFYVSRDMDGRLYLYLGKPLRGIAEFHGVSDKNIFVLTNNFKSFGLNQDDFKDLKWEDEPVEDFVNMVD